MGCDVAPSPLCALRISPASVTARRLFVESRNEVSRI